MDAARQTHASARASIASGAHGFRLAVTPVDPPAPGDYSLVARARPASGAPVNDSAPVTITQGEPRGALLTRRGPTTGNRDVPTADARFRRTERIGVEVPSTGPVQARLLDRNGQPLPVTLTPAARDDDSGVHWQTISLPLASFGAGDYVIELETGTGTSVRTLVPFRIVP
ncbi:MAG TPA: hypothetical protein VHZ73_10525 [Vicinamibacterales bacterium]|jgi:hypothetical protein|nr:hypothetical protein [Vicinamibacterales bacterium]